MGPGGLPKLLLRACPSAAESSSDGRPKGRAATGSTLDFDARLPVTPLPLELVEPVHRTFKDRGRSGYLLLSIDQDAGENERGSSSDRKFPREFPLSVL